MNRTVKCDRSSCHMKAVQQYFNVVLFAFSSLPSFNGDFGKFLDLTLVRSERVKSSAERFVKLLLPCEPGQRGHVKESNKRVYCEKFLP